MQGALAIFCYFEWSVNTIYLFNGGEWHSTLKNALILGETMVKIMNVLSPTKVLRYMKYQFYILPKMKKSQNQFIKNFFGKESKEINSYLEEINKDYDFIIDLNKEFSFDISLLINNLKSRFKIGIKKEYSDYLYNIQYWEKHKRPLLDCHNLYLVFDLILQQLILPLIADYLMYL